MTKPNEPPITTGRRTWRLIRTLALPWIVCVQLLCWLILLTPSPWKGAQSFVPGGMAGKLAAGWSDTSPYPLHPCVFGVSWNKDSQTWGEAARFDGTWFEGGVAIGWGTGWWYLKLGLWWLLFVPLLWSGFNLWRWVRHGSER